MSTVTVANLLRTWSIRLELDDKRRKWKPTVRVSVESLVKRLQSLPGDHTVFIDADENGDPIARFILSETGEILGEFNKTTSVASDAEL